MATAADSDINYKEISSVLLYKGSTKKVECTNYWDSHGTRVEYAPTQYKFDSEKNFEIWEVVTEIHCPSINYTRTRTDWRLMVEGKPLDAHLGWIEGYSHLKTKLKLDCCIGCG